MSRRNLKIGERGPKRQAPAIQDSNLAEMVERVRLAAWKRRGELDTVRRLRTDKGFAKGVVEHAINIVAEHRAHLFRDAMNAAQRNRVEFEHRLRTGLGLPVFEELAPLAPKEITLVLREIKKNWGIEEQVARPVIDAPVAPVSTMVTGEG